ncbi:type II toxin-antitoxin system HipA family toxin [Sandarakinorhabdus limnophila]|uniref:type II toxin-antitoxin system HipA family toxin n=1 Tax=Sandarakinorhabdus limnophila TaxID=210512 RepID=UPI0026EFCF87|nr:type II toxin-antitoxin system HipA family toxin [Sandarakinorhabdus limnophila]MCM0032082.1 type II toxin-antitoxin system HipA family toxin [Sandarakinorhabdus limnophila]
MSGTLSVWWNGRVAGALHLDRHGDMGFAYAPDWLADAISPALSFSLPKRAEPFGRRECQPFFGGILPEEGQRSAIARALGVSAENEFRLLEHLGGEVAGALTLLPEGETPPPPSDGAPDVLSDTRLLQLLEHLPIRPMLAGEGGLRLSLAGAQSKLPVLVVGGQIALPAPGQPTSHILKPPIARFEGTTENEYFCMSLAASIGLDVAPVEMRTVGGRSFLLIERYDRKRNDEGQLIRIHQEDFAQALGVPSQRKYASEGGPTFKDSFDLVRLAASRPARDILKLLDAAIFNLIIGNADAHAKNFSLLHHDGGIAIAPLYDLLATVAYPDLSAKLAMRIAKKATLAEIEPRHWDRFAAEVGLGAPYVHRRVKQLCDAVLAQIGTLASDLHQRLPKSANFVPFADLIRERATRLAAKA